MNRKSDEFRAQARRLEERATGLMETGRLILISVARRWRDLAQDVERVRTRASGFRTRPAKS